jgi:hypothetical protein
LVRKMTLPAFVFELEALRFFKDSPAPEAFHSALVWQDPDSQGTINDSAPDRLRWGA